MSRLPGLVVPLLIALAAGGYGAEVTHVDDVVYGNVGTRELHMDIVMPNAPTENRPCVVWIHGGGWRSGSYKDNRAAPLAEHGYVAASVEYRLSPEATFPAQIHDCKAAIRYLRANAGKYGIDPNRIGVWGGSAGGHLAALMGTSGGVKELEGEVGSPGISSKVQAVCDFYGPADLRVLAVVPRNVDPVELLLGGPVREKLQLARLASPVCHVTKDDPPTLIFHGDKDPLVPLSQSEALYRAMAKAGVQAELVRVKGAGHGFQGDQISPTETQISRMVVEFFDRHLGG